MKFSQRQGYKEVRTAIQVESIDDALRMGLWNCVQMVLFEKADYFLKDCERLHPVYSRFWLFTLGRANDEMAQTSGIALEVTKSYFFDCRWYEVYDFIELVAENLKDRKWHNFFNEIVNGAMTREMSGYRLLNDQVVEISDECEISEIESATKQIGIWQKSADHLTNSLRLLSDRKSPDYPNAVKEAISAVEAAANIVNSTTSASLGDALKFIDAKSPLHHAFKSALMKLYGYTSDADGIRHSLLNDSKLDFHDAKFFLVTCSAFVNYLKGKSIP